MQAEQHDYRRNFEEATTERGELLTQELDSLGRLLTHNLRLEFRLLYKGPCRFDKLLRSREQVMRCAGYCMLCYHTKTRHYLRQLDGSLMYGGYRKIIGEPMPPMPPGLLSLSVHKAFKGQCMRPTLPLGLCGVMLHGMQTGLLLCRALLAHLPAKYRAARQGAEANDLFFRVLVKSAVVQGNLPLVQDALKQAQQLFQTHQHTSTMDADKCRCAKLACRRGCCPPQGEVCRDIGPFY